MRAIVRNLMAAMLLVHAMIGCCRHHGHESARHECSGTGESVATAACCSHGHGCCGDEEHSAPLPCDCKVECKALCVYLPPEKCNVDVVSFSQSFDIASTHTSLGDFSLIDVIAASSGWAWTSTHTALEPPVRLHLLHQIILV